ncbi:MAG TPA: hypothetical protein VHC42_05575 [Rhizomicrobium sp.]|nr:hypothetical protein [Rhizomicrobium sp.]
MRSPKATGLLVAAAGMTLLAQTSAVLADASSEQYRGCDGYGAASSAGDGMTEWATVLLLFNPPGYGNTSRSGASRGAEGIADCDAALVDLPTKHWRRKVSLLRARALHRLDEGDAPGAISDLDLADAAASTGNDLLYARSLGLGVKYVRALAVRRSGQEANGEALALSTEAERPYDRQSVVAAMIALGPKAPKDDRIGLERALAKLVPTAVDALFVEALAGADFKNAIVLYGQLTPYREYGLVNISDGQQRERQMRDFAMEEFFRASRAGAYAFALAAVGRDADARAALAEARTKLSADTQPPPPLDPSLSSSEHARETAYREENVANRKKVAELAGQTIDQWQSRVEMRLALSAGNAAQALAALKASQLKPGWPEKTMLDEILQRLPKADVSSRGAAQALRASISDVGEEPSLETLFKALPEPETAERVPPYIEARKPFLAMTGSQADLDAEGYRTRGPDGRGVVTVGFRGDRGTASMIEEMALLRTADMARQQGKKKILIVDRRDTAFSISTTYYGTPLRTDPDGFQTELDVLLTNADSLPAEFTGQAWRLLDADEIYNALAPVYIRPQAK